MKEAIEPLRRVSEREDNVCYVDEEAASSSKDLNHKVYIELRSFVIYFKIITINMQSSKMVKSTLL